MKPYIDCGTLDITPEHSKPLFPTEYSYYITFEDGTQREIPGFDSEEDAVLALEA